MDRGISLFKVRGIQIRMHYTFPLILIFAAIQFASLTGRGLTGALFGVIVISILFVIVVLHELGHSIAAQSYGIQVKQIVLLPIGGLAQLARMPEKPSQELVISAAGPLVNFALAAVLAVLGLAYGQELSLQFGIRLPAGITLGAVFSYVFAANLFLGLFNLLPAFPMDGGRILRSLLAMRIDYSRATRWAVTIGQGLAVLMGLWGFFGGGFFLILIAFFIFFAAGQEGRMIKMRQLLGDVTVREAFSSQIRSLSPHSTLRQDPLAATKRLLAAIRHPLVHVLGHPTGRILNRREGLNPDMTKLSEAAAEHHTALELNANSLRLDLRDIHVRAAVQAGAPVALKPLS